MLRALSNNPTAQHALAAHYPYQKSQHCSFCTQLWKNTAAVCCCCARLLLPTLWLRGGTRTQHGGNPIL